MSTCTRCGAKFGCAMSADAEVDSGAGAPCWCMALAPLVKVPQQAAGCWCPACLRAQIAAQAPEAGAAP